MLHHMAIILVCYGGHFESKMAAKIQKSSDLGKILFPRRLWCCELIFIIWFAMAAILNPKWPPKYKNPPIWGKFGFHVDFALANWYPSSFLELGAILWSFRSYHFLLFLLFHLFLPHQFCQARFSETVQRILLKLDTKIDHHSKLCN